MHHVQAWQKLRCVLYIKIYNNLIDWLTESKYYWCREPNFSFCLKNIDEDAQEKISIL